MSCESELNFLCDILKRCHIRTSMLSAEDTTDGMLDSWIGTLINVNPDMTIQNVIGDIESTTKYKFVNELKLQFIFMRLPLSREKNILFIGPYLSFPLTSKEILEICEKLGLAPAVEKNLREYYAALPVISDNDRIFTAIDAFCEHIWKTPAFSIAELDKNGTLLFSSFNAGNRGDDFNELLVNMEKMEMRYALENELIQAVVLGQQHKERELLSIFNDEMFEKRLQDPVRNAKNYCIIMNTLLRKAAEQGGVHPLYIDRISSNFATKIELLTDIKAVPELMREQFSSYCHLVRKHSTKQYSPVVRKTILMIDSDISAELSLRVLAEKQGITSGYLATVFKKETGKTVSEYIRERRIHHAIHLLNTTNLQIQTIATHCGIVDVQYFSKIFKKQIGKTPKEYREAMRR